MIYVVSSRGKFPRNTPIRDMHISFQIPYVYDCISKLCRQQAQVIQHYEYTHVRNIGQGEARHRKYKRLKLAVRAWNKRGLIYVLYIYELQIYYVIICKLIRQTQCPRV
jgi:hypothetical protein